MKDAEVFNERYVNGASSPSPAYNVSKVNDKLVQTPTPNMQPMPSPGGSFEALDSFPLSGATGSLQSAGNSIVGSSSFGMAGREPPSAIRHSSTEQNFTSPRASQGNWNTGGFGFNDNKPRFSMSTLQTFFMEVDVDRTGEISHKELYKALKQQGLQEVICSSPGRKTKSEGMEETDRVEEAKAAKALRSSMRQNDRNGNGNLSWDEFIEFFRNRGMLIEYQTRQDLNRLTCKDISFSAATVGGVQITKQQQKDFGTSSRSSTLKW